MNQYTSVQISIKIQPWPGPNLMKKTNFEMIWCCALSEIPASSSVGYEEKISKNVNFNLECNRVPTRTQIIYCTIFPFLGHYALEAHCRCFLKKI